MPKRAHPHTRRRLPRPAETARNSTALTVASLGLQVRLSPVSFNRERQLAELIASCATLRADLEHLLQQVVELCDAETQPARSRGFVPQGDNG